MSVSLIAEVELFLRFLILLNFILLSFINKGEYKIHSVAIYAYLAKKSLLSNFVLIFSVALKLPLAFIGIRDFAISFYKIDICFILL